MRKYKINRGSKAPDLPPDEVINKYKNFDQFRVQYDDITKRSKTPLYKNRKIFLFLLLVALVAWLISEGVFSERKEKKPQKDKIERTKEN